MAENNDNILPMPPQAVDAEMAAIGALLIEPHAGNVVFEALDESAFYKEAHRKIFLAARRLFERNEPIDILTVSEELARTSDLEKIGGHYYLTELVERTPSAANIEHYCRIILNKSLLRRLIAVSSEIQQECFAANEDAYSVIDSAEQKIFALAEKRLRRDFTHISPILHQTFETIESFHDKVDGITGVTTGFIELDKILSGLQKSELIILAARPSVGKTALALNMAYHAAKKGVPVGIFSLEMASHQIAMRLLSTEARLDSQIIRTGRLNSGQWELLAKAAGYLAQTPIFIDDSPAMNIMEIRTKARRLKVEHNIGLLVVDYLQLVHGVGRIESRQIEIASISQSLKALAKELNIPVLSLSQLSRAVESRTTGSRPVLSDLRESGAIEQDADVVIFIHRPGAQGQPVEPGKENLAEIIVAKHRNGPTDTIELVFLGEYVMFANKEATRKEITSMSMDAF
ncbi:MAG TPA: replicative DNA helicase [bacterium]|nr:replicative DNA helicase [bacterium]HPN33139.1 replicative DNA helicase [bacterium]